MFFDTLAYLMLLDTGWFLAINQDFHNAFLNKLMPLVSVSGTGGLAWLFFGLILLIRGRGETKKASVIMLFALFLSFLVGEEGLKLLFHRARPFETIQGVNLLVAPPQTYSFPSSHSANAFAAALVLARKIPALSLPAGAFAILMAFSRVYVGVHYPLDILAGSVLGVLCAVLALKYEGVVFNILEKVKNPFKP